MKTLRSVSEKAHVSVATASRVLNGTRTIVPISEKTRRKVLEAADGLDYQPNIFAKCLRLKKSFTIGLVMSNIEDYFFGPIIRGIEKILQPNGYHFIIVDAEDSGEKELLCVEDLLKRRVDGVLVVGVPVVGCREEGEARLKEKGIPSVFVARQTNNNAPCVIVDNERGGFLATEHLILLGHRRIGFLSGPPLQPDGISRLAGYRKAFKKYGVPLRDDLIVAMDDATPLPQTGYKAMMRKFSRKQTDMTACFAYNDLLAMGALTAMAAKKRNIPEDFSIVGFDDILTASYFVPPLTTVRQPLEEMGRKAASLLLDIISKQSNGDDAGRKIVLQPELMIRKTTAKMAA